MALKNFARHPAASSLRSRSGYFGGVGCCGGASLDHTNRIDQAGQTNQMDQPPTTRREMVYEDGLRSDLLE